MLFKRDEAHLAALVAGGGTALLDEAPYGAIVASTRLDGPCWYVNRAFVDITGYDLADLPTVGDWIGRAYPDPAYRALVVGNWARDVDPARQDRDVIYRVRTKAGESRDVQLRARLLGPDAMLVQLVDVTDLRRMEVRLQQVQKAESLALLAGSVAHDFNNLLVGILGAADLAIIEAGSESPVGNELGRVILAARQAAELSRQLLAYAGRGSVTLAPLDLGGLVEAMSPLLRATVGTTVALRLVLPPEPAWVEADATGIRQILLNLVGNAVDAMAPDGGELVLHVERMMADRACLDACAPPCVAEPGPFVGLRVCDTGCGMDEVTRGRMFDPFFSTKLPGRGLGLAAVAGIVRSHGGALRVESGPGRGTTVEVLLPQSAAEASRS